jgi:hypothetical protein
MRKRLSVALAICVLSLTSSAVNPGTAHADHVEGCITTQPVGTDPVTVGVLGEEVHVPGVKLRLCASPHGSVSDPDKWLAPRIEPGVCDASIFDPLCFTVYIESDRIPHWTHWTLYTWVDGVPQEPIRVDVPPVPQGVSICLLSIGYKEAPTHDCATFVDLGA